MSTIMAYGMVAGHTIRHLHPSQSRLWKGLWNTVDCQYIMVQTNNTLHAARGRFDSLAPEIWNSNIKSIMFKLIMQNSTLGTGGNCCYWWEVNIGSGNGLVPSGNKALPEMMLTQIYFAI